MAAGIKRFWARYDSDEDLLELFRDAESAAILVDKYAAKEVVDADPKGIAAYGAFGNGDEPATKVLGLFVLLEALEQTPRPMPVIIGRLLEQLEVTIKE